MNETFLIGEKINPNPDPLIIRGSDGSVKIKIRADGSIYWNGKEVEADAEVREAAIFLLNTMSGRKESNGQ